MRAKTIVGVLLTALLVGLTPPFALFAPVTHQAFIHTSIVALAPAALAHPVVTRRSTLVAPMPAAIPATSLVLHIGGDESAIRPDPPQLALVLSRKSCSPRAPPFEPTSSAA